MSQQIHFGVIFAHAEEQVIKKSGCVVWCNVAKDWNGLNVICACLGEVNEVLL
jgi:hypothetical protein